MQFGSIVRFLNLGDAPEAANLADAGIDRTGIPHEEEADAEKRPFAALLASLLGGLVMGTFADTPNTPGGGQAAASEATASAPPQTTDAVPVDGILPKAEAPTPSDATPGELHAPVPASPQPVLTTDESVPTAATLPEETARHAEPATTGSKPQPPANTTTTPSTSAQAPTTESHPQPITISATPTPGAPLPLAKATTGEPRTSNRPVPATPAPGQQAVDQTETSSPSITRPILTASSQEALPHPNGARAVTPSTPHPEATRGTSFTAATKHPPTTTGAPSPADVLQPADAVRPQEAAHAGRSPSPRLATAPTGSDGVQPSTVRPSTPFRDGPETTSPPAEPSKPSSSSNARTSGSTRPVPSGVPVESDVLPAQARVRSIQTSPARPAPAERTADRPQSLTATATAPRPESDGPPVPLTTAPAQPIDSAAQPADASGPHARISNPSLPAAAEQPMHTSPQPATEARQQANGVASPAPRADDDGQHHAAEDTASSFLPGARTKRAVKAPASARPASSSPNAPREASDALPARPPSLQPTQGMRPEATVRPVPAPTATVSGDPSVASTMAEPQAGHAASPDNASAPVQEGRSEKPAPPTPNRAAPQQPGTVLAPASAADDSPLTATPSAPLFDTVTDAQEVAETPQTGHQAASSSAEELLNQPAQRGIAADGKAFRTSEKSDVAEPTSRSVQRPAAPGASSARSEQHGQDARHDDRPPAHEAPAARPATATSAADTAPFTPSAAGDAAIPPDPLPEQMPDANLDALLPSNPNSDGTERSARSTQPGRAPSFAGGTPSRSALSAAQLRSAMQLVTGGVNLSNGWQVLEMQLEEGDGTMTIRTQRNDDLVAVSVAFSDPSLRALAAAQTDRLQDALQARYEQSVDLSLMSNGSEHSGSRHPSEQSQHGSPSPAAPGLQADETAPPSRTTPERIRSGTTNHEWIG